MPEKESFGRSEGELLRELSEIEKRVEAETKPFREICLAIVQASTNCRDAAKVLIQAQTKEDRIVREIHIFYEFIYFFLHMTMRKALAVLSASQIQKLQTFGTTIPLTAIYSYFAHCPDEIKQNMTRKFSEEINEREVAYSECAQSTINLMKHGLVPVSDNPVEQALFFTLACNVGGFAVDQNFPEVIAPVTQVAMAEWTKMRLDTLLENAAEIA